MGAVAAEGTKLRSSFRGGYAIDGHQLVSDVEGELPCGKLRAVDVIHQDGSIVQIDVERQGRFEVAGKNEDGMPVLVASHVFGADFEELQIGGGSVDASD